MKPVLVVQHEEKCPPAWFGRWLQEAGAEVDVRRMDGGDSLPETLKDHDALLILGGTMSANDDQPWYPPLQGLIHEAVESAVPTLGICLGHQILAVTLGGRVERNPRGQAMGVTEVGWTSEGADDPLLGAVSDLRRCVQWNNDIVTQLPPDAALLAATPDGDAQAIRFAEACWGVQWHPEADEQVVKPWGDGDRAHRGDAAVDAAIADVAAAREELLAGWARLAYGLAERALLRVASHP